MSANYAMPLECFSWNQKSRLNAQRQNRAYVPQPNWWFNADANIGHAFGIFMAYVGALQPSASGAG